MKLRCYVLSFLRMHRSDCETCAARETTGDEMRRRLDELNWRTQPPALNQGNRGKALGLVDSKHDGGAAKPPVSLKARRKKRA